MDTSWAQQQGIHSPFSPQRRRPASHLQEQLQPVPYTSHPRTAWDQNIDPQLLQQSGSWTGQQQDFQYPQQLDQSTDMDASISMALPEDLFCFQGTVTPNTSPQHEAHDMPSHVGFVYETPHQTYDHGLPTTTLQSIPSQQLRPTAAVFAPVQQGKPTYNFTSLGNMSLDTASLQQQAPPHMNMSYQASPHTLYQPGSAPSTPFAQTPTDSVIDMSPVQRRNITLQKGLHIGNANPPGAISLDLHGTGANFVPRENMAHWSEGPYKPQGAVPTQAQSLLPPAPIHPHLRGGTRSLALSSTSYTCRSGCNKVFDTKSMLDHHERYHNGDKRHACTICDKPFLFPKDLRRHVKTHVPAERHLFCNLIHCKFHTKGFARKDHLLRHARIHQRPAPGTVSVAAMSPSSER